MLAAPMAGVLAQGTVDQKSAPPPGQPGPPPLAPAQNRLIQGTFALVVPEEQARRDVLRAINQAANHVGFLERGVVKSKLRDKNPVRTTVQTRISGNKISVQYGDMRYQTVEGQWTSVTALGERVQLQQWARGNQIFQRFRSNEGEKVAVMTFQPNGRMLMDVHMYSDRLPEPLHYQLRYQRSDGGGSMAMR
jgi:hypothetical protein